jgi:uncharacterized membrane protein
MDIFVLLLLVVAVFPWLFAIARRLKRQQEEQEQRTADLTRRIFELESAVQLLDRSAVSPAPPPVEQRIAVQPELSTTDASVAETAPVEAPREEQLHQWLGSAPLVEYQVPETGARVSPPPPPPPAYSPSTSDVAPPPPPPSFAVEAGPSWFERLKGGLDIEEALGANWLNKIGIVILVFGVAFFLAYQLRQIGPLGKVLVGMSVSLALLGGGIFLERKPGYRILGRAGIGGGWALTFFTTYAMYHVQATRIFTSQTPDLLLMLIVAAAMVAHTLRYRSQVVTGLAFLLAFSTLTISQVTVYSLTAGAILALGLVVIVSRMQWFELEIFGIVAAYGNHWWWLRRIIEPMGKHKHSFPEFSLSTGILLFYWAVFRASYIIRKCDERQEKVSTVAALLNSVALLGLMKYQSVHPEWAFWALLVMGTVELGLALLPITRRRRTAFLILATIGVTLLVAAIPFRYTGARLDALWLVEAEALILSGIFAREVLFRRLGMIASLLTPIYLLSGDAGTLLGWRANGMPGTRDVRLAILCLIAALIVFANSHIVVRRWPELFENIVDRTVMHRFSFVGAFLLYVGAWAAFAQSLTAVSWTVLGLLLLILGARLNLEQLPFEAHFFFASAFLACLSANLLTRAHWGHVSQRLVTVAIIGGIFYLASRWSSAAAAAWPPLQRGLPITYRWMASLLLILLAGYALRAASVSPAWVVLGLVLIESGIALQLGDLRAQGYVSLALAFGAIFFVNLNAQSAGRMVGPRLYTVLPVVLGLYYVYERLISMAEQPVMERRFHVAALAVWCGAIALAALLRFELDLDWVAAAWALCALILLAIAWRSTRELFLQQALFFAFIATFRAALHNLYERSYLPGPLWHSRALCTGATAVILFAGLCFAFPLRKLQESNDSASTLMKLLRGIVRRPEQVFFFLPLSLVVALLAVEMRRGLITVSWSALGVIVFLFALWVGERSFRLAGLCLLLLGVGKIVVIDVWDLNSRDRYLTFICMGSALLLVSFLYSRYREAIRRYL